MPALLLRMANYGQMLLQKNNRKSKNPCGHRFGKAVQLTG
jgi:hypothetical protein